MSTLTAFDAVDVAAIPSNATSLFAYMDGKNTSQNYSQMRARFPQAQILKITTTGAASSVTGVRIADKELGDINPLDPRWDVMSIQAGQRPTDYMSLSNVPNGIAGLASVGLLYGRDVDLWVAEYGLPHAPVLAPVYGVLPVAWQYASTSYDTSVCNADWFTGQHPTPSIIPEVPMPPTLNADIVCSVPTLTGKGYWDIASDGGIFAFGDAVPMIGPVSTVLRRPIVSAFVTVTGRGLMLTAGDGGKFPVGDAASYGSLPTYGWYPAPESPVQH